MQKTIQHADDFKLPKGFVDAYLHRGGMEFVSLSEDDPAHGYFKPYTVDEMVDERHIKNMIVSRASVLVAKRMRGGATWGTGLSHLEVGTGVGSGTTQVPQPEVIGQLALRVPLLRKSITSWTCLDGASAPTASDTNVVQYSTLYVEAEANGALVEMGMFGGDATGTNGSGQMFNYKTFPVINKDNTMQLTLVWKVTY